MPIPRPSSRPALNRCAIALLCLLLAGHAAAAPTRVEVGVLAQGAKFIGDATGGARVRITERETGRLLAEGLTRGGTGDTGLIMGPDGGHYKSLISEGAAHFSAAIDLAEPTPVRITAIGPMDFPAAQAEADKTLWLLPGQDFTGANRILLSLSGYLIKPTEVAVKADGRGTLLVDLLMLCGCPITPGGLWDADRIEKTATLAGESGTTERVALAHTGDGVSYRATFAGQVKDPVGIRIRIKGMDDDNSAFLSLPLR